MSEPAGGHRRLTTALRPDVPCREFRCGVHALDDYLHRHALRNQQAGLGATFLLERSDTDDPHLPPILGFYTLSMAQVEPSTAQPYMPNPLPGYPAPVTLIGRLAVDERATGRGYGEKLLIDAFARVVAAAELVACIGVLVDAKNEQAATFYRRYQFEAVTGGWPQRMFLPISTIRAAFEE